MEKKPQSEKNKIAQEKFIEYWRKHNSPPPLREIASSTSIASFHMERMVELGLAERHGKAYFPKGLYERIQKTVTEFFEEQKKEEEKSDETK